MPSRVLANKTRLHAEHDIFDSYNLDPELLGRRPPSAEIIPNPECYVHEDCKSGLTFGTAIKTA